MKKQFLLLATIVLLPGCNQPGAAEKNFHTNIPKIIQRSPERLPKASTLSDKDRAKLHELGSLEEILLVDRIVRLEATDASIIGSINDVKLVGGSWFVLDFIQRQVLKFTDDGRFVGRIGQNGEGPGEYLQPFTIEKCFDGNLAIYDGTRGCILVFDTNGRHLFTTNTQNDTVAVIPRSGFYWPKKEELYLFGFPSRNPKMPWHVRINPFAENNFDIDFGFGNRYEPYQDRKMGTWEYNAFAVVEDKLWIGPPYFNYLEVYDLQGRYAGKLGRKGSPNEPTEEDHRRVKNRKDRRKLIKEMDFNIRLNELGPLVLAHLTRYVDIYDRAGNLLAPPVKSGRLGLPLTTFSEDGVHYLVTVFWMFEGRDKYTTDEQALMVRSGYDFDTLDNENSGLRILRLNL